MSAGAGAASAGGAAVAAAAIMEATKASGVIVRIRPEDFLFIIDQNDEPLAVHATGGFFSTTHQYLTSYRGLAFFNEVGYPALAARPLPDH